MFSSVIRSWIDQCLCLSGWNVSELRHRQFWQEQDGVQSTSWTLWTPEETQSHRTGKPGPLMMSHMSVSLNKFLLPVWCFQDNRWHHLQSVCLSLSVTWRSSVGLGGVGGGVRALSRVRCVAVHMDPGVHVSSSTVCETWCGSMFVLMVALQHHVSHFNKSSIKN